MSKKWILYIGGFEMPDGNAAAQRVTANAKAFRDLGYDVFLIGLSKDIRTTNETQEYEGFKYINLPYPVSIIEWYKHLTSIKQFNPYLKETPDIIIAYNYPAVALEKLHRWTSKKNISLIADCTEWYEAKGNFVFRIIKSLDTWYRMKRVHPKLDGMITISNYLYEYYSKRMKNVVNIPPLVDLKMEKWINAHNVAISDEGKLVRIVYAGSPGSGNKDRIDKIINILSLLKNEGVDNFHLTIIGITEDQFNASFNAFIPQNISNDVVFKGRLSHISTLNEIKRAHFNLFLRDDNLTNNAGFPTKFVESISCGTPVLTNSTSNIKDYLVEGKNGFLISDSSKQSIKKTLEETIELPISEINEMKKWCFNSNTFDYSNFSSKFALLLENL